MLQQYSNLSQDDLLKEISRITDQYNELKNLNLSQDMSRGKPSAKQLDLSCDMLKIDKYISATNVDCRNYGPSDGLPELKEFFSQILGCSANQVIVGGSSSLNIMFDAVSYGITHGWSGCAPQLMDKDRKFIAIVPGYDRHFAITSFFGYQHINVPLLDDGPDMDMIEDLIKNDSSIKGMWCVPKYSNPKGNTYSDEVVKRIAKLKPAAKDFRVYWDNAYAVHDLFEPSDVLLPILPLCKAANNEDLVLMFTSTSKITFAGSGLACIAALDDNVAHLKKRLSIQTICPNNINQLHHMLFLQNTNLLKAHMQKHANIISRKFEIVISAFDKHLKSLNIIDYTIPNGGYFISVDTKSTSATRIVELCKQAGLIITPAGATYPEGNNPNDNNIRIAPTYPDEEELSAACELFCVAFKLATLENLQIL